MSLLWPMTFNAVSPGGDFGSPRPPGHVPPVHQGVDINTKGTVGNPIYGSGDGVVTAVVNTGTKSGYGLYVQVQYGSLQVRTAHMERADVRAGQAVSASTVLGLNGGFAGTFGAGDSTGPHCHVETHVGATLVNPHLYLPTPRSSTAGGGTPITPTPPAAATTTGLDDMPFFDNQHRILWPNGYFAPYAFDVYDALKSYFATGTEPAGTEGTAAREIAKANAAAQSTLVNAIVAAIVPKIPAGGNIDIDALAKAISDELVSEGVGGISEADLVTALSALKIPTSADNAGATVTAFAGALGNG